MTMDNVLAIILGGGRGTRLYPLTKVRAKPAVPLAGKYRLIDIPLSNCMHSGIQKIYVLTQFNSASLNRHISQTYHFSPFSEGFVEVLAAQQTPDRSDWFQGTADAVRQYLLTLQEEKVSDFVILSGDQLCRMDYRAFVEFHRQTDADITISVIPVEERNASDFGIVRSLPDGQVTDFREKPKGSVLREMKTDTRHLGLDEAMAERKPYIASMGIYVFKKQALIKLLTEQLAFTDFSKELIPAAVGRYHIHSYLFNGYWEDIGTIEAFYNANMQLIKQPHPVFDFYETRAPIFTRPRFLPPTIVHNSRIVDSMICDGCMLQRGEIHRCIVGIRSRIRAGVVAEHSLLMGADYFQSPEEIENDLASGTPPVGIGEGTIIQRAIIDKNARIGRGVKIINAHQVQEEEREGDGYWIRSGIVVVTKGAVIRDGTVI